MAIFLPKSDTDTSKTGGSEWEAIEHTSQTQREAIGAFEIYLSKLSEKIKNIDKDVSDYKRIASLISEDVEKTKTVSEKTRDLVIFGFFVLLLMVAGMVLTYWQFIYLDNKDTNKQILDNKLQMIEMEKNSEIFKNCLKLGGWNKCF
jgi:hypothetical protein